jgi:hypothetical protein
VASGVWEQTFLKKKDAVRIFSPEDDRNMYAAPTIRAEHYDCTDFLGVMPCSLVEIYRRFGVTPCFSLLQTMEPCK